MSSWPCAMQDCAIGVPRNLARDSRLSRDEDVAPVVSRADVLEDVDALRDFDFQSWRKCFESTRRGATLARDEEAVARSQDDRLRALVVPAFGMPIVPAVRIRGILPRHRSMLHGRRAAEPPQPLLILVSVLATFSSRAPQERERNQNDERAHDCPEGLA